jgi:hypothetical protein
MHDLRHSAAVHRVTAWYRCGADLNDLLPKLGDLSRACGAFRDTALSDNDPGAARRSRSALRSVRRGEPS